MSISSQAAALLEHRRHGVATFPCGFYRADYRLDGQSVPFCVKHHWHEELEIVHLAQGQFQVEVNMSGIHVEQECFCFFGSGQLHSIFCPTDYIEQAVVFSPEMLSFSCDDSAQTQLLLPLCRNEITFPGFVYADHPAFPELSASFSAIDAAFGQADAQLSIAGQLRVKAAILNLLAALQEHGLLTFDRPSIDRRVEELKAVLSYIHRNYKNKIYIAELAQLINLNEQYFCRFFKRTMGCSPVAYINAYRLKQAERLLRDTDLPIMDVSMECGFGNLGHFMKEFKKSTAQTPLQMRKLYQTGG